MTFAPVVPLGGVAGWAFLQRTQARQMAVFAQTPESRTDVEYFKQNIGNVTTVDALMDDRRLLKVGLAAFGLEADIGNRAFIRKVLVEGTIDPDAFANKLTDKRYFAMADEFAFDLGVPNTVLSDFAERITNQYVTRGFEIAVGNANADLRIALSVEREIGELAEKDVSADARWFAMMGNPPLRKVFQMAMGLPDALGSVDIDRQLKEFKLKSQHSFGTSDLKDFSDPVLQEKLLRRFLVRSQTAPTQNPASASIALQLLQSGPPVLA